MVPAIPLPKPADSLRCAECYSAKLEPISGVPGELRRKCDKGHVMVPISYTVSSVWSSYKPSQGFTFETLEAHRKRHGLEDKGGS